MSVAADARARAPATASTRRGGEIKGILLRCAGSVNVGGTRGEVKETWAGSVLMQADASPNHLLSFQ
jgi:hypothetical protein